MTAREEGIVSELSEFIDSSPRKKRAMLRVKANAIPFLTPLEKLRRTQIPRGRKFGPDVPCVTGDRT